MAEKETKTTAKAAAPKAKAAAEAPAKEKTEKTEKTTAKATAKKVAKPKAAAAAEGTAAAPAKQKGQKHGEFTIHQKRSGRYEVLAKDGKNVNGDAKTKILLEAKLIKLSKPKAKAEESAPA